MVEILRLFHTNIVCGNLITSWYQQSPKMMKSYMSSMDDFVDFGSFQNHEMLSILLGWIEWKYTIFHRNWDLRVKSGFKYRLFYNFWMFTFFNRIHWHVHFCRICKKRVGDHKTFFLTGDLQLFLGDHAIFSSLISLKMG